MKEETNVDALLALARAQLKELNKTIQSLASQGIEVECDSKVVSQRNGVDVNLVTLECTVSI
jgi:hypothetical protein